MKTSLFKTFGISIVILLLSTLAFAQTATIDLENRNQTIRGFGGMNFPRWIGDLTSDQVDKAFGNGAGQLGLTILRISISPDSDQWNLELPAAQRAKGHGAIILATPWSPPASMKTNNSSVQGELRSDAYDDYADYLGDFANFMSSHGASLHAVSLQNEPDWLPDYESCGWDSTQMKNFLANNASVIPTKVLMPETVHFKQSFVDPILNDAAAAAQVDIVGYHLYGAAPGDYPLARQQGKEIWMTEHYTSSDVDANSWPDALGVGEEVHNCMINNVNAYIWWYIRRFYGLLDESGHVTKRGYVMSHFSKFVRPGYRRVDATSSPASNVYVSAYTDGSTLVIVAINRNSSSTNVSFDLVGGRVESFTKYETSNSRNVSDSGTIGAGSSFSDTLAGNSIATFTGMLGGTPENVAPIADAGSDQTVSDSDDSGSESVALDGSGSYDPDGSISAYAWSEGGNPIATGATASVELSVGAHIITLTVTDDAGATNSDDVSINVDGANSGLCDSEIEISMPFRKSGEGDACYVADGAVNYINSWNMDDVEVNGQDFTNVWANRIPVAADGRIHIHYKASAPWAHFRIDGVASSNDSLCDTEIEISMPFYKNGKGDACYVADGAVNYINSWNMDDVEVNGQDFTNVWANRIPAAADGRIHIHYKASAPWAHLRISGTDSQQ